MIDIIAEIGQAHDGSLGIAHSFIDALKGKEISAIKFQLHIAEAESSLEEPFRTNFSYEDKSRFDYWKRMEFSEEQWIGLKNHCEEVGVEFLASPFSNESVDILERLGIKRYKIGSGEATNFLLLDKIAKTGKPMILSSGLSSKQEVKKSIEFLVERDINVSVMQCTTSYPTLPENWGLNVIKELKSEFNVPIGFSDHSGDIYACLAATALGAELLEFHVTFDQQMFGPDSTSSIPIWKVSQLTEGIRQIESALLNPIDKNDTEGYKGLKNIFGKSLTLNKNLKIGDTIRFEDMESCKPGGLGISPENYRDVIGRVLITDKLKNDFLNEGDFR